MKSKTSFFSPAIYKKNMSRFWPLWAFAIFFAVIIPIGHLIRVNNIRQYGADNFMLSNMLPTKEAFCYAIVDYIPSLTFIYALCVAMAVWNYLFSSKSISLMHSIPVTRLNLYITNLVSALTMLFAPFVVYAILYELIDISLGSGSVCAMFLFLFMTLAEIIIFFAIATVSAMLTGNILLLPVVYVGLNYLAVGLEALIEYFASGFIFGYLGDYKRIFSFLSPIYKMHYFVSYEKGKFEGLSIIPIYGLIGIVLLIIAAFIYSKRKSESAGDTITVSILKPVFYCLFSGVFAIAFGCILYSIFGFSTDKYEKIPITFFTLLSGVIGYYGACMIVQKRLSVFKLKTLPGLVATLLGLLLVCIVSSLDLFGIEYLIPKDNEVASAVVNFDNCEYELTDAEGINIVRNLHKGFIDSKEVLLNYRQTDTSTGYYSCTIDYRLKNGQIISRYYPIPEDLDDNSIRTLESFMSNTYVIQNCIDSLSDFGDITYISIWGWDQRGFAIDDPVYLKKIYDAFVKDVREGNYTYYMNNSQTRTNLEFEVAQKEFVNNDYKAIKYYKFSLNDTMVNTIEALNEYGLEIDEDFLVEEDRIAYE